MKPKLKRNRRSHPENSKHFGISELADSPSEKKILPGTPHQFAEKLMQNRLWVSKRNFEESITGLCQMFQVFRRKVHSADG